MDEKLISIAMEIILNAGNARTLISEAGKSLAEFEVDKAEKELKDAHDSILIAHKAQTSMIQKEAEGEKIDSSVLFNHAQDTLMVTSSEYNMTKQLLNVTKSFDERLNKLRKEMSHETNN